MGSWLSPCGAWQIFFLLRLPAYRELEVLPLTPSHRLLASLLIDPYLENRTFNIIPNWSIRATPYKGSNDPTHSGHYAVTQIASKKEIARHWVAHTFIPSSLEAEGGRSMSSRPPWATGEAKLCRERPCHKIQQKILLFPSSPPRHPASL